MGISVPGPGRHGSPARLGRGAAFAYRSPVDQEYPSGIVFPMDLDLDKFRRLAREDPDAFERARLEVIEQAILEAPPACQVRLRRLQWRIDMIRARSATPLSACIKLSSMMLDSVTGEGGLLEALRRMSGHVTGTGPVSPPRRAAKVLPFSRVTAGN